MKNSGKILLVASLLFISLPSVGASFQPVIPETTMQIARDADLKNAPKIDISPETKSETKIETKVEPQLEIQTQIVDVPDIKMETGDTKVELPAPVELKFSPDSVRVGISTTNFKTYDYDEVIIYGTKEVQVFHDGLLVAKHPANQGLKVKFSNGIYLLLDSEGSIIDEFTGVLTFTCEDGLLGVEGLRRAGKTALYRGAFRIAGKSDKVFNLVNVIDVEDYLKGVVPNEMPVRFGLEALKAQTVAARNYVLSPRVKSSVNYDVVDSVASQVYFGANTETELSDEAVKETAGIVALYGWDLILAQYSSTAGGYTESFGYAFSDPKTKDFPSEGKPYLIAKPDILSQKPLNTEEAASEFYKSKPDSYDARSPYFRWEREWTAEEFRDALSATLAAQSATGFVTPKFENGQDLGEIQAIEVKKRGDSGKIVELDIVTSIGTFKVFKELVIRRLITKDGKALPSANVVFETGYDDDGKLVSIKAFGGGYGHGVGMSQFGAGFMGSELKLPYTKILQHYYTGITLGTAPVIISADESQNSVTQEFFVTEKKAQIVVDNKFQVSKLRVLINGKEHEFELCKSFFPMNRICRIEISKYLKKGLNSVTFYYPTEEGNKKALRLFVELVKSENSDDIW